jgi:hypothetical protein
MVASGEIRISGMGKPRKKATKDATSAATHTTIATKPAIIKITFNLS